MSNEFDIHHIARLAKLQIPDQKLSDFERELAAMVDLVADLPTLTSEAALLDENNTMQLRPDEMQPSSPREEILRNAPAAAAGCFVVPKTVE